ncbi:hypothetical protein FACS1894191_3790 [Clostridia bacterium]|nr:hypothetical protein FACS1894191_3790 [Clostridia bacterium]
MDYNLSDGLFWDAVGGYLPVGSAPEQWAGACGDRAAFRLRVWHTKDPDANPYYFSGALLNRCARAALELVDSERPIPPLGKARRALARLCETYGMSPEELSGSDVPLCRAFAYFAGHNIITIDRIAGGHRGPIANDTEIDIAVSLVPGVTRREYLAKARAICEKHHVRCDVIPESAEEKGRFTVGDTYTIPREKIKQLETLLSARGVDALLILSREGSDKILPFLIGADTIHLAAVFFTRQGEHAIITSKADEKKFRESGIFERVLVYEKSLSEHFVSVLNGISPNKLALNISESDAVADNLTLGLYKMLEDLMGAERLHTLEVSAEEMVRELRSVKTPTEIALLKKSIDITTDIYDEVFTRVKRGMSETEIGDIFVDCMKKRDVINGIGEPYDYPIVCIVRCGLSHRGPGAYRTVPGDILIMDFSVRYEGYVSDIARTAYFLKKGETQPPGDIQHAFNTAYAAITNTIGCIAAGKRGWEVDAVGRKTVEDGGFPTVRHAVGHPIGRECHDSGTLLATHKGDDKGAYNRPIQINEVYAIEPTVIQDNGLPCMLVEENVLITEDGPEILSRRQEGLYLIQYENEV